MTDLQKALIELLDELDGYCKSNKLHYVLAYEPALSAYRSKSFETYMSTITVLMPYDEIIKLGKIIKKENNSSRRLDSIVENPDYPNLTFRYSNEDTLYYNMRDIYCERFASRGVYIKISPLKKTRGGFAYNLLRKLELGLYSMSLGRRLEELDKKSFERCEKLMNFSKKLYMKLMNRLLLRINHDEAIGDRFEYDKIDGEVLKFPKGIFEKTIQVELEGKKYPIPEDVENYFSILYTFDWRNKKYKNMSIAEGYIIDTQLPYRYYFDYVEKNKLSADLNAQNERLRKIRATSRKCNKPIDNAWQLVQRSAARNKMMLKYLPMKDEIIRLMNNEEWDTLDEMLTDYQEVVAKFMAYDLAVYFDKDIYEAYKQLAIRKGQNSLINAFEKNIPEIHR